MNPFAGLKAMYAAFIGAMVALFMFIVLINVLAWVISKLWFWLLVLALITGAVYGLVRWRRYRRDGW